LPYQQIITKFEELIQKQQNNTKDNVANVQDYTYTFLHNAIDEKSGDIKAQYICWFLSQLDVLKAHTGQSILEQRLKQMEKK